MIRNRLLAVALVAGLSALLPTAYCRPPSQESAKKFMVYFGTYTSPKGSEGIYRAEFDPTTGKLSEPKLAAKMVNPTFLAIHPSGKYLYAVGEISNFGGKKAGGVAAFAIDQKSGDLTLLNQESSIGAGPCHITLDKAGKYALAANYGGGSAVVLPIGEDGKLGKASSFVQHKGKSVDKGRQQAPHGHSINLDAANKFAFVADLGLDKVMIYQFADGKLKPNDPPSASVKPGAGPRHFSFHPSGKYAYVINEMHKTITAFTYDAKTGELKEVQTISTVPKGWTKGSTAEVVVHPSGKFVYGSNRGHDSIAVFAVDEKTGKLKLVQNQGEGIKTPRNFALDPTGKYCLVANQDGGSVLVFKVDQESGKLTPTGEKVAISRPVCVRYLAWPR